MKSAQSQTRQNVSPETEERTPWSTPRQEVVCNWYLLGKENPFTTTEWYLVNLLQAFSSSHKICYPGWVGEMAQCMLLLWSEFGFQEPHWVAHNCLWLQHRADPMLPLTPLCTRTNPYSYTQIPRTSNWKKSYRTKRFMQINQKVLICEKPKHSHACTHMWGVSGS